MTGNTKAIKNELKSLLQGIQYLQADGVTNKPLFTKVNDNFTGTFENYPAARILPRDIEGEEATNIENDRIVPLTAVAYIAYESDDRSETAAIDLAYDICDLVQNAIDEHGWTSVPNNIVSPAGVRWLVAEGSTGAQISLEFDVRITYSKDI